MNTVPASLDGMTYDVWVRLTEAQRGALRSNADLTPQLSGYEGRRVEVVTMCGETRRFWVGRSTGWRPCHLEIKTSRSMGGDPAEKAYKSVRVIRMAR